MKNKELFVSSLKGKEIVVKPMCDKQGCGTSRTHPAHAVKQ